MSTAGELGPRTVVRDILVRADPHRVWEAIATADGLSAWFPRDAIVAPGDGGHIEFIWSDEMRYRASITRWEPPRRLLLSTADPATNPEAPLPFAMRIDHEIDPRKNGVVCLRLTQSGFPRDAAWDDFVEGCERGWDFQLEGLRRYLERGRREHRQLALAARPALNLTREHAWARLIGPEGFNLGERDAPAAPQVVMLAVMELSLKIAVDRFDPGRDLWGAAPKWDESWFRAHLDRTPEGCMVYLSISLYGSAAGDAAEWERRFNELLEHLFPNAN
ncbi:MAG: SRPBCC domain-containing protein [Phycisphaerales bacterium]